MLPHAQGRFHSYDINFKDLSGSASAPLVPLRSDPVGAPLHPGQPQLYQIRGGYDQLSQSSGGAGQFGPPPTELQRKLLALQSDPPIPRRRSLSSMSSPGQQAGNSSCDKMRLLGCRVVLVLEAATITAFSLFVSLCFGSMAVDKLESGSLDYLAYFTCAFVANIFICVSAGLEALDRFAEFFMASATGIAAAARLSATKLGCRHRQENDAWALSAGERLIIPAFFLAALFVVPSTFSALGVARDMQRDSTVWVIQQHPQISVLAMVLYTLVTRMSGTLGLISQLLENVFAVCRYYPPSQCVNLYWHREPSGISQGEITRILHSSDCRVEQARRQALVQAVQQVSANQDGQVYFRAEQLRQLGFSGEELRQVQEVGLRDDRHAEGKFFRAGFDERMFRSTDDYLSRCLLHPNMNRAYTFLLQPVLLYLTFSLEPFWLAKTKLDDRRLQGLGATASNFFYMRAALNLLPALSLFLSSLRGCDRLWLLVLVVATMSGRSMSAEVAKGSCVGDNYASGCDLYDGDPVAMGYVNSTVGRVLSPPSIRDFGVPWTFLVAGLAANGVAAMNLKTHWRERRDELKARWNGPEDPATPKVSARRGSTPGAFGFSSRLLRQRSRSLDHPFDSRQAFSGSLPSGSFGGPSASAPSSPFLGNERRVAGV